MYALPVDWISDFDNNILDTMRRYQRTATAEPAKVLHLPPVRSVRAAHNEPTVLRVGAKRIDAVEMIFRRHRLGTQHWDGVNLQVWVLPAVADTVQRILDNEYALELINSVLAGQSPFGRAAND